MHRSVFMLGLVVSIGSLLIGCGGAEDTELDDDLPADFDSVSEGLTAEVDPSHEASGDHERDCGHNGGKKKGRRLHHLFKRLDRLDGAKDKQIVIASLPDKVPARLIEKLKTLDTNNDGIVTKDEVKAARKALKHARKHHDDDDHDRDDDHDEIGEQR